MQQNMPVVNVEKLQSLLSAEDLDIVMRFIKKDGTIRASKPNAKKHVVSVERVETEYGPCNKETLDCIDPAQGNAAYVWRHVVFYVSKRRAHQCIPSLDICYLPNEVTNDGFLMSNPKLKHLHDLVEVVVDCVDKKDWHGVKRWRQALGRMIRDETS